ncbi:MAG: sulfatase [Verrucomicrobia bacterium]|nr:sulfatase [Verrucomicrobiota bacterium]
MRLAALMKPRLALFLLLLSAFLSSATDRPNIVWIIGEDMGPELGSYGDKNAITPNMDRLAREGARYTHCFAHAPVCAPSRFGLITGQYPTTGGAHHMRSRVLNPPPMFTEHLKKAGYTICWPKSFGKTDFNFEVPKDAFDLREDWTRTKPPEPFFGYFNITTSHESKIRVGPEAFAKLTSELKPSDRQEPAKMEVPPYHPDTPEVRRDLANYYELVTAVDYKVGEVLDALERWNMGTNTIVVFFGDHGRGLPRSKRWVYDSGIHVPLIVRWPGQIKPGEVRKDLVSFIDLAPTMLSVAGVAESAKRKTVPVVGGVDGQILRYPPMQGSVVVGPDSQKRKYIYAARDRMDETDDRIRAVRDHRFKYIRNFEPQLPYAQRISYGEEMPTMQVWRDWNAAGKLNAVQKLFFAPTKPKEELYDCEADPHEVKNLANDPKHAKKLKELRAALDKWIKETKDLGAVPETELIKRGLVEDKLSGYEERKTEGWKKK